MASRTSPTFRLSPIARLVVACIRGYQLGISPYFPPRCRFYPSCSAYALEAVKMHGVWRGFGMSLSRICRCNPWGSGGYDPVPPKKAQ